MAEGRLPDFLRSVPDDRNIRASMENYMTRSRHLLHSRWPTWFIDESGQQESGVNCLTVLVRHINFHLTMDDVRSGQTMRTAENQSNKFLNITWVTAPWTSKKHASGLRKYLMQNIPNTDLSFASLETWDKMESTFWSRLGFQLFNVFRKDGDADWEREEGEDLATRARHQVITIDNRRSQAVGFDVPTAISKRCGLVNVPSSPTSRTYTRTRTPDYIRVVFTPSERDNETLESLQGFRAELTHGKDTAKRSWHYTLIAAVKARSETAGDADQIRIFDVDGLDFIPEHKDAHYSSLDWQVGAFGNTYYLYYVRTNTTLAKMSHADRLERWERLRGPPDPMFSLALLQASLDLAKSNPELNHLTGEERVAAINSMRTAGSQPAAPLTRAAIVQSADRAQPLLPSPKRSQPMGERALEETQGQSKRPRNTLDSDHQVALPQTPAADHPSSGREQLRASGQPLDTGRAPSHAPDSEVEENSQPRPKTPQGQNSQGDRLSSSPLGGRGFRDDY